MRCIFIKRNKEQCRAHKMLDSTFCFRHNPKHVKKVKELLLNETDIQVKDTFRADLKKDQASTITISGDLDKLKVEKEKHSKAIMSYEQFLELFNDLPDIISKTKSLKEKDYLLGKTYLNCVVKDKKVLSCQLNPPFNKFVKSGVLTSSRIAETTLELYDFIINNLDTVDKFNEDVSLYLQGKKSFQQSQYMNVML